MIHLRDVQQTRAGRTILDDVSLSIEKGELVALVGPSGAGKTSLLRLMHFDDLPTGGEVEVAGYRSDRVNPRKLPLLRRKVGMVFQDFKLLMDRNVFENVAFALRVTRARRDTIVDRTTRALAAVDMVQRRNVYPSRLSRGEQQRVAIARAFVHDPVVLLADEPTGSLDRPSAQAVLGILRKMNLAGTTILLATHDTDRCPDSVHRILRIENGRVHE